MRQATKIVNNANDEQNSFRTWNMKTAQGQNDQTVKLLVYQVGMKVKDSLYENTFSILRYFMFFIQLQTIFRYILKIIIVSYMSRKWYLLF